MKVTNIKGRHLSLIWIQRPKNTKNFHYLPSPGLAALGLEDASQQAQELRVVDERLDNIASARANLAQGVKGGIALDQGRIRKLRNDDLHKLRDEGHSVFSSNAGQLAQAHQNIRRDRWVGIVCFRQQRLEHRERIWLDEPLRGTDEER